MNRSRTTDAGRNTRLGLGAISRSIATLVLGCTVASPALADGARPGAIIYDALIERPLGVAETAVGIGVASVAYPVALASNNSEAVVDRCISEPVRHTFTRPLGKFRRRPANLCSPIGLSWSLVGVSIGLVERPLGLLFGGSPFGGDRRAMPDELEVDAPPGADEAAATEIAI